MNLSNKTTPIQKIKFEDSPAKFDSLPNWENFKCEIHPQFKIDALNVNKNTDNFTLLCIKCIIEGDVLKSNGEEKLVTIKELLQNCTKSIIFQKNTILRSRDGLQDKFLGFLTRDYIGSYERHLEEQYQLVDQEISDIIENLHAVRAKYKEYYNNELETIKTQGTEIKTKINKFLEENIDQERPTFLSQGEIYDQLGRITTHEELHSFLKELYLKSKECVEDVTSTDDCKLLLESMESLKTKALNLKDSEVETSQFEDIKRKLENLLQSDSIQFKKSGGTGTTSKNLKRDFEHSHTFGFLDAPINPLNLYNHQIGDSQMSFSPVSREDREEGTAVANRQRSRLDSIETAKKKKRSRFNEIESQSLRNLKRELEKAEEEFDGSHNKVQKREKVIATLNDWINRRITGYLIFQNTMNTDPEETKDKAAYIEKGMHLNSVMGKKWKSLTEKEKEEYRALAKEHRKPFKLEVQHLENFSSVNDLLETLDEKIKKIKKE